MCIRDRRKGDFADYRLEIAGVVDNPVELSLADLRALPHHCLLYTSDAADERSSVDLGGRRIIKKKKKTIKREWRRG